MFNVFADCDLPTELLTRWTNVARIRGGSTLDLGDRTFSEEIMITRLSQ